MLCSIKERSTPIWLRAVTISMQGMICKLKELYRLCNADFFFFLCSKVFLVYNQEMLIIHEMHRGSMGFCDFVK